MNAKDAAPRKNEGRLHKKLGWLMEEWVVQLALVFAVVTVLVDGLLSLGGGSSIA
jgi:hypothetical protein